MPKTLIIGNTKFNEWKLKDEEREFHPLVKSNFQAIFGEQSLYFDIKPQFPKLKTAETPDAYVITLSKPYKWYIVENELSSKNIHQQMIERVTEFTSLITNAANQKTFAKALCTEIEKDRALKVSIEKSTGVEIGRFILDLLAQPPAIALITDKTNSSINFAINALNKLASTEVTQLTALVSKTAGSSPALLLEPIKSIAIHCRQKKLTQLSKS